MKKKCSNLGISWERVKIIYFVFVYCMWILVFLGSISFRIHMFSNRLERLWKLMILISIHRFNENLKRTALIFPNFLHHSQFQYKKFWASYWPFRLLCVFNTRWKKRNVPYFSWPIPMGFAIKTVSDSLSPYYYEQFFFCMSRGENVLTVKSQTFLILLSKKGLKMVKKAPSKKNDIYSRE